MAKKKDRGWIKLHRKIQDSAIWSSNEEFNRRDAWVDLLLLMNHVDRTIVVNGKAVVIEQGQHWTSYRILADRWHWSVGRVKRYLDLLSELGMCTVSGTPSGTLLTVVNYGFYQGQRYTDEYTHEYTDEHTDEYTDGSQTRTKEELYKNERRETGSAGEPSWEERE